MKKKLQAMLESIINEDVDKASKHFHSYLSEMIAHETGMEYKDEESSEDPEISSDDEGSEEKSCDCECGKSDDDEVSDEISDEVSDESEFSKEEEM